MPRPHPPPPPGFPTQPGTTSPNTHHSPDPTDAAGEPTLALLDRLFDYDLYPSSHAIDLLTDNHRPDPSDRGMLHGDPCPTDAYDPPHDMDSKAFLELFLEEDLSPSREKEILEEYLLK